MSFSENAGKFVTRHFKVHLDTGKESLQKTLTYKTGRVIRSSDGTKILAREEYDSRSGKYKIIYGEGDNEKIIYSEKFDTDKNRTTYLYTVIDEKVLLQETEKSGLSLFSIDPRTKARATFSLNANVPSGYEYGPLFDNFTNELIGIGYTDDLFKEVYSAEPYKSWHAKAKKALRGKNVTILSRTRDNSMVTLFAEGPTTAGAFYLFEPKVNKISSLGGMYPELKPSEIGKTIRVDYTARDGLKIPAYLTLPPGKSKSSGPMSMVVMPHGGPIARDDASFDFWAQYLASKGYVVFKPQFRGSSGFGYSYEKKGFGEFGAGMLEDTVDGVKHLIKIGVVNPDKICVTGASYGGYQALALPMIEPDMFKCAISVNGVSDIPDMLKFVAAINGNDGSSMKFWTKVIGNRYEDKDMMIAQSPADNADKIKAEILLVHGTDDMTVPLQQSEAMAKALKKTGRSKKIIELPNDDHNLSLAQSRKKLLEESEKFFSKHLD